MSTDNLNHKQSRKLRNAFTVLLALAVTALIATGVFLKSGLPAYQLSKYVNDSFLAETHYRFACGEISGDMVNRVSIARPVLRYDGPEGVFDVFSADRVTLDYSLLQVLTLKMRVSHLDIERPTVILKQDSQGDYLLPLPKKMGATGAGQPSDFGPVIEIEHFTVAGLTFHYKDGLLDIAGTQVDAEGDFHLRGNDGDFEVQRAAGRLTRPALPLQSFGVEAEFTDFSDFKFKNIAVRLANSFVIASGRYESGKDGAAARLYKTQLVFNPLDLGELVSFGLLDEAEGELGGNLLVEGLLIDSLRVEGTVTGKAFGYALSGMSFVGEVGEADVVLSNVEGGFFGARVNGELRWHRPDGSFGFDGVCEGLDLSEGIVPGAEIPASDLNGLIALEYDASRSVYEITADLRRSMFMDFRMDEAQARLSWREDEGLRIRSLRAAGDGYELHGSGTLDPETNADIIVSLKSDNLDYIADYLVLPRFGGSVDLSGRVVGPLNNLQVNLNGVATDLAYLLGTIDTCLVQAEARGVGSESVEASVAVTGESLYLSGHKFSNPHVFVDTQGARVIVRDFSFSRGDTLVTMDFDVDALDTQTRVHLKHLVVHAPEAMWQLERATDLVVNAQQTIIDSLSLRSNGHTIGVAGSYTAGFEQVNLRAWGDNLELSVLSQALVLPFRLEGIGSFQATVVGELDDPLIELSVQISQGAVDSLTFDYFDLQGGYDRQGYRIDRLLAVDRGDSITGTGRWSFNDSPFEMSRDGWRREQAFSAPLTMRFDSHRYPVRAAMEGAHIKPFWRGSFTGSMTVDGTLADPVMKWSGQVVARPFERYQLPDITTELSYQAGRLTVANIALNDGKTSLKITGSVPMEIGAHLGVKLREDQPVNFDVQLISKDLSTVAPYFEEIGESGGQLSSRLVIGGTAGSPTYQGSVTLKNGLLRLANMKETFRDVEAEGRLDQRVLRLSKFEGKTGKRGVFSASGELGFKGFKPNRYRAVLDMSEIHVESIEDVVLTQGGSLKIESEVQQDGRIVPMITGTLDVKEAWIYKSFTSSGGGNADLSVATDRPSWLCNIDVNAPKNVWVKNPDLSMELGGRTVLRRDNQGLFLRGDLEVLRGSYSLYNNKFRITEGRFDFSRGTTLRPEVFLSAYTPHRVPGQEERRIFLTLTWTTDKKEPELHLSYDLPGYSEPDLWRMLGGQIIAGEGGVTAEGQWDAGGTATNVAANYLERVLNARMADMTIDIETRLADGSSGTNAERELSVAIGRYLSEDLYMKYRQGLNVSTERQVDIEYRISNMVLLRSQIIQYSGRGIAGKDRPTSEEMNFDLKFRWEY